jgi:hypothetical protein
VAPVHEQHPVRGSFLDPRTSGYHNGVDISVPDDAPERGAPPRRAHRVYAIEGGRVWRVIEPNGADGEGIVRIGHFGYGHVDPVVALDELVRPGQVIGWTVAGEWHLHLTEWYLPNGDVSKRIPVNPLCRDGKLAPYVDTAQPMIKAITFFTPTNAAWRVVQGRAVLPQAGTRLGSDRLTGVVDIRARIEDRQSFVGWLGHRSRLVTSHHPERVELQLERRSDGAVVFSRTAFSSDVGLDVGSPRPVAFSTHYAPGTKQNLRAHDCLAWRGRSCRGALWFHLFGDDSSAYWDTTEIPDGRYLLTVKAWDLVGNVATRSVEVAVVNTLTTPLG